MLICSPADIFLCICQIIALFQRNAHQVYGLVFDTISELFSTNAGIAPSPFLIAEDYYWSHNFCKISSRDFTLWRDERELYLIVIRTVIRTNVSTYKHIHNVQCISTYIHINMLILTSSSMIWKNYFIVARKQLKNKMKINLIWK